MPANLRLVRDLLEALTALKACRDVMKEQLSPNAGHISSCYPHDMEPEVILANKILAKYPNLK